MLQGGIKETVNILLSYFFKYRKYNAITALKKGFKDHEQQSIPMETLERIVTSYNKAKENQKTVPPAYQVGAHWQRTLDEKLYPIIEALREKRLNELQGLFANQQRKEYGQAWGGYADYYKFHNKPFFKYEFINYWYKHYEMYKEILGDSFSLSYPLVGNPVGLFHENMVIPMEAIRFSYGASQLLTLVEDIGNPVICEIGGGQGGLAYATITNANKHITYMILDIPEILALASYFLCAAFPDKKVLMYGEGDISKDYDIILMPNFCLPDMKDESADLFFNQRSFPEMERATVTEYLTQIGRVCSRYLYHINYNNPHKGKYGLGYVQATQIIPDADIFKKVIQFPWLFTRLGEELQLTYIAFLYERRR